MCSTIPPACLQRPTRAFLLPDIANVWFGQERPYSPVAEKRSVDGAIDHCGVSGTREADVPYLRRTTARSRTKNSSPEHGHSEYRSTAPNTCRS